MAPTVAPEPRLAPLDPFVAAFLERLADRPAGFAPASDAAAVAAALDWPPPFVHVVFVSSRVRRLIAPAPRVGKRGSTRWALTEHGRRWLEEMGRPPRP
jgi:hypothetical protein